MKWIFLSPHLDDVAFSCGGLVWDLTNEGQSVEIWTINAGDPQGDELSTLAQVLHNNWGLGLNAVEVRRAEDKKACQIIGAAPRYFPYLDCIYRKTPQGDFYYSSEGDIFGGLDPREVGLLERLSEQLRAELPEEVRVVAPLGIGNHVDHELVRKAVSRLDIPLLYYPDYPYAREEEGKQTLKFMGTSLEWQSLDFPLTDRGLESWIEAAGVFQSQISTFWEDDQDLGLQIREFSTFLGENRLWMAIENH